MNGIVLFILSTFIIYAPKIIGVVMPVVVEILNRDVPRGKERFYVTVIICLLISIVLHWNEILDYSFWGVLTSICLILGESQLVYRFWFKESFTRQKIQEKIAGEKELQIPQRVK